MSSSVNCTKVRPNGTFSHFARRNGIRPDRIRQSGKTPKREQAASEVTLQQLETGANPPPWKKKYRQLKQRVERVKEKMSAGKMSISEYFDAIGHN